MHFGYSRPHQSSNAPDQERGGAGRAASDAETTELQNSTQRGSAADAELPPQITEWMRRKKRKRRVNFLRNSVFVGDYLDGDGGDHHGYRFAAAGEVRRSQVVARASATHA